MSTTSTFVPFSKKIPSEILNSTQIQETCDVSILSSGSVSVTSIVSELSYQFQKLGVTVALSGDPAIFNSSVCILILCKDFADSTDRLEELRGIHEHKVDLIPIFYGMRPSDDVQRVDEGVFRKAFARVSEEEGFHGWKVAFERTALLPGLKFSGSDGSSRKLLKAVVQNVMDKVNIVSLQVAKNPVGLAEKTGKLEKLLEAKANSSKAKVLGIVGKGGIGKTTLAKEFFNIKKVGYKAASFIEDVKGIIEKSGVERVQSQLLKDILKIDHEVHSINQGKYLLKKCLNKTQVLIVLDNIDDPDHLDALLVPEYNHPKSIVLITTRDQKLVECIPNSLIYNMEGLDRKYARELFCRHAFLMPHPAQGFDHLVEEFVTYCDVLPLSLQVLGGKLFGEEYSVWEKTLKNISESFPGDSESQLRFSFDALDVSEKKIFLDIAIFFIGEDKEMAIRIWDAMQWDGSVGVLSLQQRCLVKVDNCHFKMHDQLRQMAEKIVEEENTENPGCRSLLWRPSDIRTVLSLNTVCFLKFYVSFVCHFKAYLGAIYSFCEVSYKFSV
ncbi:hypothetical protein MKW92_004665 [Papaver armeniacum]|nr:hypothetical protein MKW92_004665 [Papaver armeniacum]